MNHADLVYANLRRRPLHNLMTLACVMLAFTLYGLTLGVAEGFRQAGQRGTFEQQFLLGAIVVTAAGVALILLLTTHAMANAVRLRVDELGLLQAIGFSHRRITLLLIAEAAVPTFLGALLGLMAAKLLHAALTTLLPPLAVFPSPAYSPVILAAAFLIALFLALVSAVIPARRIARLDAAVALAGGALAPAPARSSVRRGIPAADAAQAASREHFVADRTELHLVRQILAVTAVGLSTLRQRMKGALLIVGGVGCVVFVLLSLLSMAEGIRLGILGSGDTTRVVLRSSSTAWLHNSKLPAGLAEIVATAPGVARAADGTPLVEAAIYTVAHELTRRNNGKRGNTMLVGVGAHWPEMTPSFRLLTGRMPRPGERELIAGDLAQRKFLDPDAGETLYGDVEWRIVGTFTTGGWWGGYLVGDAAVVKAHSETTAADSAVLVKLTSPEAFAAFHAAAVDRLPPSVIAERETDYYASFWQSLPKSVIYVAFILSGLIATGTIAGLTQIMHSSLEERRREIATLRILGFDGVAVAASVVLEGLLLALLGAVTATAVVWLWLDGRLYNGAWDVFRITVNLHLLLVAIGWSAAIALIGTLPLAYRALRQGEWEALQELSEAGEPALTLTRPVWFASWSRGGAALPAHTSA